MDKIQVVVMALQASNASNNAYVLLLKEMDGKRQLPIIIGAFEAQAIALELEGVKPPRPMTHDLIKTMIDSLCPVLSEIYINDLKDGTYYAKLIFDESGVEIDARPSDAIAIAVRYNSPIFVNSEILDEAAFSLNKEEDNDDSDEPDFLKPQPEEKKKPQSQAELIQQQLDKAIKNEDYEKAASLRDELKRILESS
jgi:bifunctional DNase/RNase